MKKEIRILGLFSMFVLLLVVAQISALDTDVERRMDLGHVMIIDEIRMQPEYIAPGESGVINVKVRNNAKESLTDELVQRINQLAINLLLGEFTEVITNGKKEK